MYMKNELNIEKLEGAKFKFSKEAFRAKSSYCSECKKKMNIVKIEMDFPNSSMYLKIDVFRCDICKKEYLNFEEAKKLDKALIISRLMNEDSYRIKKSLSFDGNNYIFRIPAGIAKNLGKNPNVEMVPISSKDLLIHINEG